MQILRLLPSLLSKTSFQKTLSNLGCEDHFSTPIHLQMAKT